MTVALALAGCQNDPPRTPGDPFAAAKQRVLTIQPAAPRWERVTTLEGTGEKTTSLRISMRARRWRVRWHCTTGVIELSVRPRPAAGRARRQRRCQRSGTTTWIQGGAVRLSVAARGHWGAVIDQQLDTPLREPPLRAMRAPGARLLASGHFYPIEAPGIGTASLYQLPSDRLALRFTDLRTSAYPELVVWISRTPRPKTTQQVASTPHIQLAALKSTRGSQNYLLPKNVDREAVGSVVIWWTPVKMAYTAAALQ